MNRTRSVTGASRGLGASIVTAALAHGDLLNGGIDATSITGWMAFDIFAADYAERAVMRSDVAPRKGRKARTATTRVLAREIRCCHARSRTKPRKASVV